MLIGRGLAGEEEGGEDEVVVEEGRGVVRWDVEGEGGEGMDMVMAVEDGGGAFTARRSEVSVGQVCNGCSSLRCMGS